jgi:hypothetical protein
MLCYLDLVSSSEVIPDRTGVDFASRDQARAEIARILGDEIGADPTIAEAWPGWTLRVVDRARQPLFSISLTELAVPHESSPRERKRSRR